MNRLSRHHYQMVCLNQDWVIKDIQLEVRNKTLTLPPQFVGDDVMCPECGTACSMKDHAAERTWRYLDGMKSQTIMTARFLACLCDDMRSEGNCGSVGREAQSVHSPV